MALLFVLLAGCQGTRRSEWAKVTEGVAQPSAEPRLPDLLSDAQLKSFLPDRLGERRGQQPQGIMTRMGDRALSEATRSYPALPAGEKSGPVELKIADALLEPRASQTVRTLASDPDVAVDVAMDAEPDTAERLVLPGAIGYARFDQGDRVAQAQVLIGNRFIASATVAEASDSQQAAQVLRAVDTLGLAHLAQLAQ